MLGLQALVAFPHRQALRRLQEALGPIGVFFDVHVACPFLSLVRADVPGRTRLGIRLDLDLHLGGRPRGARG